MPRPIGLQGFEQDRAQSIDTSLVDSRLRLRHGLPVPSRTSQKVPSRSISARIPLELEVCRRRIDPAQQRQIDRPEARP